GGLRQTIVQNRSVPSTVDYFFNRWQENYPWPVDFERGGQIFSCEASSQGRRNCDQDSQNIARNADFSPITRECRWDEAIACPGSSLFPPRTGRVQVRVSHQDLPRDAYLQQVLGDRIISTLANFRPPPVSNSGRFEPGFFSRIGMNPPGIIYLWPSPWDGGRTDVWCNVPNHSMYVRHLNDIGSAIEVNSLEAVTNSARYWSQPCSDDVFQHSRVQN
ncbi:MAG: hypothetical protein ACKPA7_15915, partial [Sphaerospermopsis kisseleviana]